MYQVGVLVVLALEKLQKDFWLNKSLSPSLSYIESPFR